MPNLPPREPLAVITLRMPQSMLDALDKLATQSNSSREATIRAAIAAHTQHPHTEINGRAYLSKYDTPTQRKAARKVQVREAQQRFRDKNARTLETSS